MERLEIFLSKKGLTKMSHIDEVLGESKFLVDTNYSKESLENKQVVIYPLAKKKNLTHRLLNLYGTHWSYIADVGNWKNIKKREGDSKKVLKEILEGKDAKRFSKYAFTQKYIEKFSSLWVFKPETEGWQYHQEILVPRFKKDMQNYKTKKRLAKQS